MKKIIAGFLIYLFAVSPLFAWSLPTLTYQVAISSIATISVQVSTSAAGAGPGATQVDVPQLAGRVALEIQNLDASANLWCLPISTAPVVGKARKIAAGATWVISTSNIHNAPVGSVGTTAGTPIKFWCVADGTQSSTATVTQLY